MITFISSLLYLNEHDKIQFNQTIERFSLLIENINVIIFVSFEYLHYFQSLQNKENIIIIPFELSNTWIYRFCTAIREHIFLDLPKTRNLEKDTFEFILNAHAKHELIEIVINQNKWNTTHFAWIDFTIVNMFHNLTSTIGYLKMLNVQSFKSNFITFPGCWQKLNKENAIETILGNVHWRFCGGYFLGDQLSIIQFCKLYREQIEIFIKDYKTLIWDFNFWAWLEITFSTDTSSSDLNIEWYSGDHNDSIVFCSADLYTNPLNNVCEKYEYQYPSICDSYYPTSASYLYYNGKHWLNTRYVNYWIYPNGFYLFHNNEKIIENKNVLSELDEHFKPIYFKEVVENINIPIISGSFSQGLEDVRLYEPVEPNQINDNIIKYIATTIGYSSNGKSKMIYGDYDLTKATILNGNIISSPNGDVNNYEKNWIPIKSIMNCSQNNENERNNKLYNQDLFIYKLHPFQIGKINDLGELEIIENYHIQNTIFNKMRGSSRFVETQEGLIGIIHFSEEHHPRHYYHMLLLLDKTTLCPLKHSNTFCFEKIGIEFCLGFTICREKDQYIFWISRHDRDPVMIKYNCCDIQLLHNIIIQ